MGFVLLNPCVLNTADYGVPQTRKRAIAIGIKKQRFNLDTIPSFPPSPSHQNPENRVYSCLANGKRFHH